MGVEWKSFNPKSDELPKDAIWGGVEANGQPLYIARSYIHHEGKPAGLHPGKYGPDSTDKRVLIGLDGKEVPSADDCEILCGEPNLVKWIDMVGPLPENYVHHNLVEAGKDAHGNPLFCAQIEHKGSTIPGRIGPHMKAASAAFDGREVSDNVYTVLAHN